LPSANQGQRPTTRLSGWRASPAKSNLSRTLETMEGYGLVRLERGERGRIMPKVTHDRVELDLPL
jgi:predicted transcriptional regulator